MNRDLFDPLNSLQDEHLCLLGSPLLELEDKIEWEELRGLLLKVHDKERKGPGGARPRDVVMMFKGLVIQNLYGLSDDQLEYQIQDRRSFQRFLGLAKHERAPDSKTFWLFRNGLTELDLMDDLFDQFARQLNRSGWIARKGQIVDATIVPAPVQRNKREENAQIKQGDVPEDWEDNKRRQKDTDARWTKKNGQSHYGYKNHIEVDNAHKLIRKYQVSDASVHDSKVFEDLLDRSNTSKDVWADSAYRSKVKEASLIESGYRSHVQRKGSRDNPLSQRERQGNRTRSKVRSRVEHIFGAQVSTRNKFIRCIGMARTQTEIGLMNMVYNMRRYCFLERVSPS